jgi:hypothetical protein
MMHITAHSAHSGTGAMPVHMHIPPIGDVQYVQHPVPVRGEPCFESLLPLEVGA